MKPKGLLSEMMINAWNSFARICENVVSGGMNADEKNFLSANIKPESEKIPVKLSPHDKRWMKIRYPNLKFRHNYEESQTLLKVKEKKKISLNRWRKIWSHSKTK